MNVSQNGIDLIKSFEGLRLSAYKDSAGIPTIGYGSIRYENGATVKMGDTITLFRAEQLISYFTSKFSTQVNKLTESVILTQNQFDSLVSLSYNIGIGGFASSSVLKQVLKDPNNERVGACLMMWNKATVNGKKIIVAGLTNRRLKEVEYYFSK